MLTICVFSSILLLTFSSTVFSEWSTNTSKNTVVSDTGYAMFHRIISDGRDGYFVVWDTSENCGDTYRDLYAQHYDVNGNALWGGNGIRVSDSSDDSQKKGGIITDGEGGLIVTWNNYDEGRMGAQRINADGTKMWPEGLDVAYGSDSNRCASDGAGGVIIGDEDGCQRIDATGTPLWGPDPDDPDGGLSTDCPQPGPGRSGAAPLRMPCLAGHGRPPDGRLFDRLRDGMVAGQRSVSGCGRRVAGGCAGLLAGPAAMDGNHGAAGPENAADHRRPDDGHGGAQAVPPD